MAFDQIQSSWALFKRSSLISYREPFNYALRSFGLLMLMAVRLVLKNRQSTLIDNECFNSTRFAKKFIEMGSNPENYKITAFLSRDIILLITSVMFTVIISLVPSLMLFPLELSVFIKVRFFFPSFIIHLFTGFCFQHTRNIQTNGTHDGHIIYRNHVRIYRQHYYFH